MSAIHGLCLWIPCIGWENLTTTWLLGQKKKLQSNLANCDCSKVVAWLFWGSLYSQLYDFILAAIQWAQRDFRVWFNSVHDKFPFFFSLSLLPPPSITFTWHSLHLVFTLTRKEKKNQKTMPAKPGALIEHDTNLHLLSVWREFPNRNKGLSFPKPKLEVQF